MHNVDSGNFPRGGRKVTTNTTKLNGKRKHEDNLFGVNRAPKSKKARKEKRVSKGTVSESSFQSALTTHGTLSYNKMQDGMVVLASVRRITNLAIQVEFPGFTHGQITINNVSDKFTQVISERLKKGEIQESSMLQNIISVGQLLPAKILSVQETEKGFEVQATINPKNINENMNHSSFKKGMTIWANIVSELDHGLELTVGVNNCRVFMPSKNLEASKRYAIGQPLYCVIHKCESASTATTLTVTAKSEYLDKIELAEAQNLDAVIPGTKVEFEFEQVTPYGIRGKFLQNFLAYIDETQIFSKVKKEKLIEGAPIPAYVLYVEPITKVTHLTLRGLEILPEPTHQIGQVLPAIVTLVSAKGLFLKLENDETGFVTNRRLVNTLGNNDDIDIIDAVNKKYPTGSKHSCRILDYNRMQQLYICTFEQKLVKEKVFNVGDLSEGQKVSVTIKEVIPKGLIVTTGQVQGFVSNFHLSNTLYSENIKSKFIEGAVVNARVLNITNEGNVLFTLKQGLVEAENCLIKIKDAVPGTQYCGYVLLPQLAGTSIAFFGNAKTWIAAKQLNSENEECRIDPRKYFFRGQVVNVWCSGFKNGKVQMSLDIPTSSITSIGKKIRVGAKVTAVVTAIQEDCVDVAVETYGGAAKVPLAHLSRNLALCYEFLRMYKVGDKISDLVCWKNEDIPLLSKRETYTSKGRLSKLETIHDLKIGMVLRCSFDRDNKLGIFVSLPLRNFNDTVFIPYKDLIGESKSRPKFEKYQCILAKVVHVNSFEEIISLDARIPQIRDNDIDNVTKLFESTLLDIDQIIEKARENGNELVKYKIGEKIKCTIKKLKKGGCSVSLPNGVVGTVRPHLGISNAKVGDVIEGVVLDYNFADKTVEICLKNDIKQKINKYQDGVIEKAKLSSIPTQILLITEFYALGLLKGSQGNRQLVYLPLKFHENDQNGIKQFYSGSKIKVSICSSDKGKLFGVPKKLIAMFNKEAKLKERRLGKKKKNKSNKSQNLKTEDADITMTEVKIEEPMEVEDENNDANNGNDSYVEAENEQSDSDLETENEQSDNDEEIEDSVAEDSHSEEECDSVAENGNHSDDAEEAEIENLVKEESDADEAVQDPVVKDEDTEEEEMKEVNSKKEEVRSACPVLSGVNSFYATEEAFPVESSSDEETQAEEASKKKKKLTGAEKAELARKEEERISKIEKELADSTVTPQTAAQFDRLLLANPNSAGLWLKYMAMHVASTELDKARAVGKRALEAIDMSFVTEKFNVWMALLNLENMYGTKDTFEELLEEALKCNDSLEIYLKVIKMLAASGKLNEMEEKIKKVRAKEKQNTNMWVEIGQVYYSLQKFKEARNFKAAALNSILDNKRQFDLIMRFGIMEFQYGELEHAIANFEAILSTYPTKINIWIIYVDQLIKRKEINLARKVLERGIKEKFPVKTMRTMFQKFVTFEEQYGNPEAVKRVKDQAKQYVSKIGGR